MSEHDDGFYWANTGEGWRVVEICNYDGMTRSLWGRKVAFGTDGTMLQHLARIDLRRIEEPEAPFGNEEDSDAPTE